MDPTEEILTKIDAIADQGERQKALAEEFEARIHEVEQKMARRGSDGEAIETKSWGDRLVESEEFKDLIKSGRRGAARINIKAITSAGNNVALVPTDARVEPVALPRRRPRVRDLLATGRTNSNAVRFVRMASRTNLAGVVSEGDTKPESTMTFEQETADVQTLAHWTLASKQILDDAPALSTLIDTELRWGLQYAEEQQLLNGDGTGVNLHGMVPQADAYSAPFSVTASQALDTLLLAKAQLEVGERTADWVVLNSLDWAKMLALKDGENRYIAGGPFSPAAPEVWNMRVIATNAMTVDKFLVGSTRSAIIWDRQDVTVEISTEDSDNWRKNLCTVRAEERLAFGVMDPSSLIYGDFGLVSG